MRTDKSMRLTPAALAAASRGDLSNALLAAATPGGIEAQEAAGQATFCASATLPKKCPREKLEKLGVKFGKDHDDLFVCVTLPPGWKKQATDHSMHSDLLDDKGRKRGSIFYKAAFYDRRADMYLAPRYSYTAFEDGSDDKHYRCVIKDGSTTIHLVAEYSRDADYWERDKLRAQAESWLKEHFPQWEDDLAYWD